jgi:2-deoxy-D-gluconate 3-dehydrogenase
MSSSSSDQVRAPSLPHVASPRQVADLRFFVGLNTTDENTATRDAIIALGRKSRIYVCDLASKEEVRKVVPTITAEWNEKIHILVNCGGIQRRHKSEDFPDDDWEEVIQVNLSTCFTLAR